MNAQQIFAILSFIITLVLYTTIVCSLGYNKGRADERNRMNRRTSHNYADYDEIDEQMTMNDYIDIINRTVRRTDEREN